MTLARSIVVLALCCPVASQADPEKAEASYLDGIKLLKGGRSQAAIIKFEEAYQEEPLPEILFNIAHTYRTMGESTSKVEHVQNALQYYLRYVDAFEQLEGAPGCRWNCQKKSVPREIEVSGYIHGIRERIKAAGATEWPRAWKSCEDRLADKLRDGAAELQSYDSAIADVSRSRRGHLAAVVALLAGGALVAAGGGTLLGVASTGADNAKGAHTLADHNSQLGTANTEGIAAAALLGIGGAAIIGGIIKLATHKRESEPARPACVWVAPSLGGLVAGGIFE